MKTGEPLLLVPTAIERTMLEEAGGFWVDIHICGFGPVAAAARTSELVLRRWPSRVILIGICGTYRPEEAPVGSAHTFGRVRMDGVGVGEGEDFQGPSAIGFPQWEGEGTVGRVEDSLDLPGVDEACLLSVCSGSASPTEVKRRCNRFPDAVAEDMEGFGVALSCAVLRVPLQIVRGVSNVAGDRNKDNWHLPLALYAAREKVEALLTSNFPTASPPVPTPMNRP